MTRLEQAHAAHAKRHETRMAVRAMSQKLVQTAGHKPSTTIEIAIESNFEDFIDVAGARRASDLLRRLGERLTRGGSAER